MPGRVLQLIWPSEPHLNAPARYRRACRYDAFVPDRLSELNLTLPATTAGLVSEAEAAVAELNAVSRPALIPLARLLLKTESIASSKVEGLELRAGDLARAEARMETGGRASRTAVEILANIRAMEHAVTEAAAVPRFGEAQLLAIHHRLMGDAFPQRGAGRLRNGPNWIGGNDYNPCGADFVPPPVEELPRLLADLYHAVNDELLPPVVQAALVHAQFETLHPFDDGNGRTGRALIHVILRRRGVAKDYVPPVSVVLALARERYIEGLTRFRADGVLAWIEQFAAATVTAALLARQYLGAVAALMDGWRGRLRRGANPRADAAAWAVIDVLPAHPVITGPLAAASTGRSRGPVYQALAQLEEAGILIPLSPGRRNQAWEATGLLDLLEALEAGRPVTS